MCVCMCVCVCVFVYVCVCMNVAKGEANTPLIIKSMRAISDLMQKDSKDVKTSKGKAILVPDRDGEPSLQLLCIVTSFIL